MKIKNITVRNFKAVSEQELNLNGASVIVTAGNNKGKTSVLRGLVDRFRGDRPEIIVKDGEEKGENHIELTDGSKIGWSFTKKTENFYFTTPDDIKMTTGVLSAIGEKYFGQKFDIEKFLQSSRTEQTKQVQKLLGIDLADLDEKYKGVFDKRTDANREVKRLLALDKKKPEPVDVPDIEALKKEKSKVQEENQKLKDKWKLDNEKHQKKIQEFNESQNRTTKFFNHKEELEKYRGDAIAVFIDFEGIEKMCGETPEAKPLQELTSLDEPEYISLSEIDKKIEEAYENKSKADSYQRELEEYNAWVKEGKQARELADKLSEELEEIKNERLERIKSAKLPDEFEMTDDGLLYNGLPLDNNQISSSAKYICALKLGALVLGKIRTLHFDCSPLDKNSLMEIQKWAEANDLQLLLERPDFEGGDIKYQIIEELE